jgi:GINS complex subunit 4
MLGELQDIIGVAPVELKPDNTYKDLIRAWINERHSPCLLPFQTQTVRKLIKMTVVNDSIYFISQQEIERIKFVLRSYLHVRLTKLEKYSFHYLNSDLLSQEELDYVHQFFDLIQLPPGRL